jgi:hypothetical protein
MFPKTEDGLLIPVACKTGCQTSDLFISEISNVFHKYSKFYQRKRYVLLYSSSSFL